MALNNLINVPLTPTAANTSATQTQFLSMLNSTSSWFTLNNVNAQTGTTYTVQLSDYGKLITFSNAAAITVTLPQQSTTATSAGFFCWFLNIGAGTVTVVVQGAETLIGGTLLITNQECKVERYTTTAWGLFGNSGLIKIAQATASGSSTISFTGLNTSYRVYFVYIDNFLPDTANAILQLRTSSNNGSSYDSGATDYGYYVRSTTFGAVGNTTNSTGATLIPITSPASTNTAGLAFGIQIILYNPALASSSTSLTYDFCNPTATNNGVAGSAGAVRYAVGVVNAIQFFMSSGLMSTGNFILYGLTN